MQKILTKRLDLSAMIAELKKKFRIFRLIGNKKKKRKDYFDAKNSYVPTFSQKAYIFETNEEQVKQVISKITKFYPNRSIKNRI